MDKRVYSSSCLRKFPPVCMCQEICLDAVVLHAPLRRGGGGCLGFRFRRGNVVPRRHGGGGMVGKGGLRDGAPVRFRGRWKPFPNIPGGPGGTGAPPGETSQIMLCSSPGWARVRPGSGPGLSRAWLRPSKEKHFKPMAEHTLVSAHRPKRGCVFFLLFVCVIFLVPAPSP